MMSYPSIVDVEVDYKFCLKKHKQLIFLFCFQYGNSFAIQGIDVTEISVVNTCIPICVYFTS